MSLANVTRHGVENAVAEYDRVGKDTFLDRYGFGPAREYFLVIDGRPYDSKAIVGAAHGFDRPDLGPLGADDFSGGQDTVQRVLESLGFTVEHRPPTRRNPRWAREELILALELYLSEGQLDDTDEAVIDLSAELNALTVVTDRPDQARFRNPNGVAMKLGNLAALDPSYPGKGLTRGGKGDVAVWEEFGADLDAVAAAAQTVRSGLGYETPQLFDKREPRDRPIEQTHTKEFSVPDRSARSGQRREQDLVHRFAAWLETEGHQVTSREYPLPGKGWLVADLYDRTTGTLYEAKSNVRRESIRMAVGQLFDYRRFETAGTGLCVLVPKAPSSDVRVYLKSCDVGAVWPDGTGFTASSEDIPAR